VDAQSSWQDGLALGWLVSSLGCLLWMLWRIWTFQRLLGQARPAPAGMQRQAEDLARQLGLRCRPAVYLVAGAVSPMVWAFGRRPRLLFPARLLERLDRTQRATLLVHELAHVCRRDHWVRLLEVVVQTLYWWHPLVWWARRELREAEEHCCDAWVVSTLQGAGRAYALALLQTVALVSQVPAPLPVGASGIGQVPHLRRRLTMIMQGKTPRSLSWAGCLAVLATFVALPVLPVAAEGDGPVRVRVLTQTGEAKGGAIDDEIARLKKQIEALEQQKKAEQAAKAQVDVHKLEKEAAELKQQIEVRRRELAQLQKRYGDVTLALDRLRAGQTGGTIELEIKNVEIAPRERRRIEIKQKEGTWQVVPVDKEKGAAELRLFQLRNVLEEKARATQAAQPGAKMPADLEQKLDRLLKEVEDLRRELHERQTPKTPTPPAKR
jgi:hypothetical protein